ncbi:toll/interleukin-1 receptor domain-containing protein [Streptomyces coeruleoprunus]|uniref:Toll/interleukin-1 receptor domain-containing protein n=1 Tax=Streptomyces coeruleoprunus TaxID=285563 RepID=A0ABV9XAJ0_9ACTN
MPDVFINYRTGDGEQIAVAIDGELSHRFGSDRIFRASKSLEPGSAFDEGLLRNVRRSGAVVAVIGPGWARCGQLHDEGDWVRRELEEALRCAVPVVPVLIGRHTERLSVKDLPSSLEPLARIHSIRFDTQDAATGLRRIGDAVADLVPELAAAEKPGPSTASGAASSVGNSVGDVSGGTVVQARDIGGDVGGTIVKGAQGPVHLGSGDQHNHAPHLSGNGAQYVAGDNNGGVRHYWDGERPGEDRRR